MCVCVCGENGRLEKSDILFHQKILLSFMEISIESIVCISVYPLFHLFFHTHTHIYIYIVGRVLANSPGDLGSIPGCIIPKTLKMVLDTSLLNTRQYKVRMKSKVDQSRERSSALHYTSM